MARRYKTLRDYFEDTGETQDALARKLNVTAGYISLITSGQRQPALDLALDIERLTGVPVESLVSQETGA